MHLEKYITAFSQTISENLESMYDVSFKPLVDQDARLIVDQQKSLPKEYTYFVQMPFYGSISGDYFVSLAKADWQKMIGASTQDTDSNNELVNSELKEFSNVVCNEAIEILKRDFPDLSVNQPRLLEGNFDFPKINMYTCQLNHQDFHPIYATICLNLSKSDIGRKLDQEIEVRAQAVQRAQKAEWAMKTVLATIPLGILCLDDQGMVVPGGGSVFTQNLLFKDIEQIEGKALNEIFPQRIKVQNPSFLNLLEQRKNNQLNYNGKKELSILQYPTETVEFERYRKRYIYEINLLDLFQENQYSTIIIIQDRTQQTLIERQIAQAKKEYTQKLEIQVNVQTLELRKINQHLVKLNTSLEKEKTKAEQANQFKSQFLAAISHDLRTPLHAIIGINDALLSRTQSNTEMSHSLQIINKSADRLLLLVNDLLDLSKLEAGKLPIQKSIFKISDLLFGMTEMTQSILKEKPIKFVLQNKTPKNTALYSDKEKIHQVLTNLIGNSTKFTEKGEIRVIVDTQDQTQIIFTVSDTGLGIKKEDQDKVFQLYAQVDNQFQKTHKGTGLGLNICKQIVEKLGGKIDLQSQYGQGTTIRFSIPLEKPEGKFVCQERSQRRLTAAQQAKIKKHSIVICDDDEFNLQFLEMILAKKIKYTLCESGYSLLDALAHDHYDLILLDIQMPQMDGWTTFKEIRKIDQQTPIVALTAQALLEDKALYSKFGFNDCFLKPFKENEFFWFLYKKLIEGYHG